MSREDEIWKEASPSQEYWNRAYPDGSMTYPEWLYENHQTEQRVAALKAGKTIGERLPPPPGLTYERPTGYLTYEQLREEAAEAIRKAADKEAVATVAGIIEHGLAGSATITDIAESIVEHLNGKDW